MFAHRIKGLLYRILLMILRIFGSDGGTILKTSDVQLYVGINQEIQ